MNKGRNFLILMSCLLLLSVLTFLTRTKMSNNTAVIDNVRYILKSAEDNTKNYEFYFVDETVMTGTLKTTPEEYVLTLYVRGDYFKYDGGGEYETEPYAYYYTVTGTDKQNASVKWHYNEDADGSSNMETEPYGRFTENVFKSMVFGTDPFINIWQALTVGIIAVSGGTVIVKAEEIWHIIYRRPDDDTPAWEDMSGIKRTGIGILIFDAVLLILFIFI